MQPDPQEPPITRADLDDFLKKLAVVWMSMVGTVLIFGVATLMFISPETISMGVDPQVYPAITVSLALLGAADVGAAVWIDRRFRSAASVNRYLSGRGATAIGVEIPGRERLDDRKLSLVLFPHYLQLCMIRLALMETIALYGLVLALVTGAHAVPGFFYLVAALMLLQTRPQKEEVLGLVAEARRRERED